MKPELLPDKEAFIELPPSMDLRKPGQVEPWDSTGRFYSGKQWSELDLRRMRERANCHVPNQHEQIWFNRYAGKSSLEFHTGSTSLKREKAFRKALVDSEKC